MGDQPPQHYSPEGTPLGRSADNTWFGPSYSTESPRAARLWWRIRDLLHRPVKNSGR
ncbi:hypothetical protein [Streptomyces sp. TLI_146]|uniref:hypothetical protein n=1 Tax=Streptomyces sp. TLI_146 TaxID=1938858 RepID=UPI000CA8A07E|nr:hypothetical protein [Streptomyces sp. TLI_146]PKV77083.1 hypothetical protein BX283_8012 [Streptomyces sp. TLI_146]